MITVLLHTTITTPNYYFSTAISINSFAGIVSPVCIYK